MSRTGRVWNASSQSFIHQVSVSHPPTKTSKPSTFSGCGSQSFIHQVSVSHTKQHNECFLEVVGSQSFIHQVSVSHTSNNRITEQSARLSRNPLFIKSQFLTVSDHGLVQRDAIVAILYSSSLSFSRKGSPSCILWGWV